MGPRRGSPRTVVRASVALLTAMAVCALFADAVSADDGGHASTTRTKRQLPPIEQGNQVIDSIFQIPISTLNAVGSLIKNTRPLVRRTRERIQQYYYNNGQQQRPSTVLQYQQQQQSSYGIRPYPTQYSPSSASSSQYGVRPYYYNSYSGSANKNYYNNNNRKKQQRDDPLPQGRGQSRSHDDDN